MTWRSDGALECDTCRAMFDLPGQPRVVVTAGARARGWHCFEGSNLTGTKSLSSYLCEDCIGSSRPKRPAGPPPLAGDAPLFEL